jgi:hypothetical protein
MVVQRASLVVCALVLAVAGCGSEAEKKKTATADQGAMTPPMAAAGSGNFGNIGEAGSPSTAPATAPSTTPSTTSGSGGSASAGSGGSAGSENDASAGSSADMADAAADSVDAPADAGVPAEDDPFAGLFDPGPVSCDGYLCLEAADCAALYPEENTTCKFTNCVDFLCTK